MILTLKLVLQTKSHKIDDKITQKEREKKETDRLELISGEAF